jgi:exopolysaccharide biosynthesis WecB/TagA/CpsF family protein
MNLQHVRPAALRFASKTILDIPVANVTQEEACDLLLGLILERRFTKVGFLNAHNANVAQTHAAFSRVLADFLVLADGVGVDLAAKLLYGAPFRANLNGTDFIPAFLQNARKPLKVGLLGAKKANVRAAAAKLSELAPHHDFSVVHDGFFDEEEERSILAKLARHRPDILLVAMGVPKQEFWIAEHLTSRHCTLPIAVGALFDFLSGAVPRAPRLMRQLRLEWLFRLWVEPGRLWRRYIVGNPLFLFRIFRQKFVQAWPGQ